MRIVNRITYLENITYSFLLFVILISYCTAQQNNESRGRQRSSKFSRPIHVQALSENHADPEPRRLSLVPSTSSEETQETAEAQYPGAGAFNSLQNDHRFNSFNNYNRANKYPVENNENYPNNEYQSNSAPQSSPASPLPKYTPTLPPQQPKYDDVTQQSFRSTTDYVTPIPIIKYNKVQAHDGSYKASYETGNNIIAEETGFIKNVGIKDEEALVQHGSYSYTAPDGNVITVTYTADEGGFRAEGAHLPTPPPVPAEIQRALDIIYEQIRLDAEREAREGPKQTQQQDGQYNNNEELNDQNYPASYRQQHDQQKQQENTR